MKKKRRARDAGLTRAALAARLKTSMATIDRLLAAGHLRSCGRQGRAKLYRLEDARKALARAGQQGAETPWAKALIALLGAQKDEAHAREMELRSRFIHTETWAPEWRAEVAAVRGALAEWAKDAPARILGLLGRGLLSWETFLRVQEEESRPLLDAIADRVGALDVGVNANGHAVSPNGHHARRTGPATIAGAKTQLIEARAAVTGLRAAQKSDAAWRRRVDVEQALATARAEARSTIWGYFPNRIGGLAAGATSTPAQIGAAVREVVAEALRALAAPLGRQQRARAHEEIDEGEATATTAADDGQAHRAVRRG